jgi:Fe/S biogenesis protein NfuA
MTSDPTFSPVLRVTDAARAMVLEARTAETDGENLALWLEVTGIGADAYTYDLFFQSPADAGPGDAVQHDDEFVVVVPEASVNKLQGATLDVAGEGDEAGMVVINPNTPTPPIESRPPADLSGDVAQRVLTVLETQVNPSIAAHGGRADLVAVEEGTAYLRLSGGCQGCGLASVTLTQGISVAISDSVPEVTSVVDVTDHQSGTNPFYEPAKK